MGTSNLSPEEKIKQLEELLTQKNDQLNTAKGVIEELKKQLDAQTKIAEDNSTETIIKHKSGNYKVAAPMFKMAERIIKASELKNDTKAVDALLKAESPILVKVEPKTE